MANTEGLIYLRGRWVMDKSKITTSKNSGNPMAKKTTDGYSFTTQELKEKMWTLEARLRVAPSNQKPSIKRKIEEIKLTIGESRGH